MGMQSDSSIKHYTRGGQITLHNIRMFVQITNKVSLIAAMIFLLVTASIAWNTISEYERYVCGKYLLSNIVTLMNDRAKTDFIQSNGRKISVKYSDIANSNLVSKTKKQVSLKLIQAILCGLAASLLILFALSDWLRRRGQAQAEDHPIKGDEMAAVDVTTARITKDRVNSDLILGGLPLIRHSETTHLFFHGTVGTGKSNAIKELLDQIRKRGDRAVIYDKSCNFLEEFYQSNFDILLNPLDVRGKHWLLWQECRDSADFDSYAAAQIPMPLSSQDPFWIHAARTIFSAAAFEMRNDPNRSVGKLLRYLLTADLDVLQRYLKGTEAETLVSEKIEKTAISIKSVLATYLKSMKYIQDDVDPFSIRQWIQDEKAKNWLFITSLADRHETLKPLISAWLDIAVNALMSLPPNQNRRIWLILDELPTLQQLPYLTATLSESRKFGGCIVIGAQNYAQIEKIYGPSGAREISSLLNTRYLFRQPDPEIARWSASNFGESITDEVREGISYGANTMRDGISINRVETRKPLVSYSEVMSLANLHAYVRLPGKYPITPVSFIYKNRPKANAGFILRHIDDVRMKEIDEVIEQCEKPGISVPTDRTKQKREDHALDV